MNYSEAEAALSYISPNCTRDDWWPILAAIKSEHGDAGYSLALQWSQNGDTFSQQEFDSTWRSLTDGGVTIKTLFRQALDRGWKPDKLSDRSPNFGDRQRPKPPPAQSKTVDYARRLREAMNRDDQHVAAHPYATRKGITWACGAGRATASGRLIGQDADCIVVPMRLLDGTFTGVEVINSEGTKQTFGRKGMLVLGNTLDESLPIYIVEGWADAASLWRIMGNVVVIAAFGKANMEKAYDQFPNRFCTLVEDA